MTDDFWKELVNRGFAVYGNNEKFYIKKTATPLDPRISITNEILPDTSMIECASYDEAINKVKQLIQEEVINLEWRAFLKYSFKTFAQYKSFTIEAPSYEEATILAQESSEKFVTNLDFAVTDWQVKVRPA